MDDLQTRNIEHNKQIYDSEFGDNYDNIIRINDFRKKQHLNHFKMINRILGNNVMFIADLGCGTGEFTLLLYDAFPDAYIFVVDVSEKMLDIFYYKLTHEQVDRTIIINMDMEEFLSKYTSYFDVVFLSSSLHHMISWRNVLKLISQKTKCLYLALEPYKMDYGLIKKFIYYSIELFDRNNFVNNLKKNYVDTGDPDIGGGFDSMEIKDILKDFYVLIVPGVNMRHIVFYYLQNLINVNRHFTLLAWNNKLEYSVKL